MNLVVPTAAESGDGGGVDRLRDAGSSLWHGETLRSTYLWIVGFERSKKKNLYFCVKY